MKRTILLNGNERKFVWDEEKQFPTISRLEYRSFVGGEQLQIIEAEGEDLLCSNLYEFNKEGLTWEPVSTLHSYKKGSTWREKKRGKVCLVNNDDD